MKIGKVGFFKFRSKGKSVTGTRKEVRNLKKEVKKFGEFKRKLKTKESTRKKESKAKLRAKEIVALRGKESSKYETFCVGKVRNKKTGEIRTVITSSTDHKTAPENIKLDAKEKFVNSGPVLVRRPLRGEDGKIIKDEHGKIKTQTFEKVEVNGENKEIPYDRSTDTRHHAEQRLKRSLSDDEELTEVVPTRPCCPECQKVLGCDLKKVPEHLRGKQ